MRQCREKTECCWQPPLQCFWLWDPDRLQPVSRKQRQRRKHSRERGIRKPNRFRLRGESGIENENSGLATAENLIAVGVSQVGSESVFRTANTESLQRTFTRDNGYFLIFDNARQKQENQIKALRNFISQRVDYIVLSPLTEDGWDTVLLEAKEADIPVILIDRRVDVEDESCIRPGLARISIRKEERRADSGENPGAGAPGG